MLMTIRMATRSDVEHMVALSELKRTQYERYAPTFWRKARDANERQGPFFLSLLERDQVITLVHEAEGQVDGFVIASIRDAPPVYDPGTSICTIDDFVVATSRDWPVVGMALLAEARKEAKSRGAELTVVVCGSKDEAKRIMLRQAGFEVSSEWYVNPL
jgi:hypothetical protein